MVYFPRICFKTGISPSLVRTFPTDGNYTGTQKLMLTSSRIFGTKIGYSNHNKGVICDRGWNLSGMADLPGSSMCNGERICINCTDTGPVWSKTNRWNSKELRGSSGTMRGRRRGPGGARKANDIYLLEMNYMLLEDIDIENARDHYRWS